MTTLRERLLGDEVLYGTFALADSPVFVELLGVLGFDFIVIDCEHAPTGPYGASLEHMLRAADAAHLAALVRVRANEPGQIGAALDAGAQGVVVPHITSAAEMRRAVAAAAWPPLGRRGAAPVTRAARYGAIPWVDYQRHNQPLVFPLIEDPEGVMAIEAILAVPGVGGVWFGAFDLGVALGVTNPQAENAQVEAARDRVYAAAQAHKLPIAAFAWDAAHARQLAMRQAHCIAISTDISLWGQALRELRAAIREDGHADRP